MRKKTKLTLIVLPTLAALAVLWLFSQAPLAEKLEGRFDLDDIARVDGVRFSSSGYENSEMLTLSAEQLREFCRRATVIAVPGGGRGHQYMFMLLSSSEQQLFLAVDPRSGRAQVTNADESFISNYYILGDAEQLVAECLGLPQAVN